MTNGLHVYVFLTVHITTIKNRLTRSIKKYAFRLYDKTFHHRQTHERSLKVSIFRFKTTRPSANRQWYLIMPLSQDGVKLQYLSLNSCDKLFVHVNYNCGLANDFTYRFQTGRWNLFICQSHIVLKNCDKYWITNSPKRCVESCKSAGCNTHSDC